MTEQAEPEAVRPELTEEYERLLAIARGNARREDRLAKEKGLQIDLTHLLLAKLDTYLDFILGSPTQDKTRLEFEIKFAENIRGLLDRTLAEAPAKVADPKPPQLLRP